MLEPTYHFVKYCIRNILFMHLRVPNPQISQFAAAGMRLISGQSAGAMPKMLPFQTARHCPISK